MRPPAAAAPVAPAGEPAAAAPPAEYATPPEAPPPEPTALPVEAPPAEAPPVAAPPAGPPAVDSPPELGPDGSGFDWAFGGELEATPEPPPAAVERRAGDDVGESDAGSGDESPPAGDWHW